MKTTKMSLANIQGKLSRSEMKNIMAGSNFECGSSTICAGSGDLHCPHSSGCKCDSSQHCVKE